MMRNTFLSAVLRLFALLVVKGDREPMVGDLLEEYAVRSRKTGAAKAWLWTLKQICTSAPTLFWTSLARAQWPATLGIAMLAWLAVAVLEAIVNWTTSAWPSTTAAYNPAAMFLTMPLVAGVAFITARARPHAAFALAVLMLLVVTLMTLTAHEVMPLWFRIAYFIVGPAATWMGAHLQARFWPRHC